MTVKLNLSALSQISDEQFYKICQDNAEVKLERNSAGEILIMSPTGGETGLRNFDIIGQFWLWNSRYHLGYCFDSSTGFKLPNGANRSPDVAYITKARWESLSEQQREIFPPIAPDFVLELLSPSDNLKTTQEKMKEYLENGVKLGWLIDRQNRQLEVYRQDQAKQIIGNPDSVSDQDVLPQFCLSLVEIW